MPCIFARPYQLPDIAFNAENQNQIIKAQQKVRWAKEIGRENSIDSNISWSKEKKQLPMIYTKNQNKYISISFLIF